MKVSVRTYINRDARFDAYQPDHGLDKGPALVIDRRAGSDPVTVLDKVWDIGNRMSADAVGHRWPSTVRSLSVGDVISFGGLWWAVASFGFDPIDAPKGVQ